MRVLCTHTVPCTLRVWVRNVCDMLLVVLVVDVMMVHRMLPVLLTLQFILTLPVLPSTVVMLRLRCDAATTHHTVVTTTDDATTTTTTTMMTMLLPPPRW